MVAQVSTTNYPLVSMYSVNVCVCGLGYLSSSFAWGGSCSEQSICILHSFGLTEIQVTRLLASEPVLLYLSSADYLRCLHSLNDIYIAAASHMHPGYLVVLPVTGVATIYLRIFRLDRAVTGVVYECDELLFIHFLELLITSIGRAVFFLPTCCHPNRWSLCVFHMFTAFVQPCSSVSHKFWIIIFPMALHD